MSNKEQRKIRVIQYIIEEFVYGKSSTFIHKYTALYSGGILDSLEMLELVMELESYNLKLNFEDKYIGNKLDSLDSIKDIIKHIK